jgi:AraC-like DNA-binding protein
MLDELALDGGPLRRAAHPLVAAGLARGYKGYSDRRTSGTDTHLPFPNIPVIFGFGAPMHMRGDGTEHTTFVAGMFESPSVGEMRGPGIGIQVDFTPIAAHRFLGVPMHELANRTVELDDIFGADARDLVDQLREAPSWTRRFALIDAFLIARMGEPEAATGVAWAWHRLAKTRGAASIGELASELGWSRRHLVEKFREEIGLPPKAVARIMRFTYARRMLERSPACAGAELAYRAGYYDQAHMIRDFREFAGATPAQLVRDGASAGASIAAI